MLRKTLYVLLVLNIVTTCITLQGCRNRQDDIPVLRLGYAPHDHHSPLYIAASNPQYFRDNGGIFLEEVVKKEKYFLVAHEKRIAEIIIKSSTGGKEIIRKLIEGQYDFSFGGVPAVLHFIDAGADISIISPVMAEGAGFVVAKDLPVSNWQEFIAFVRAHPTTLRIGYKIDVSVHNLIFEFALQDENIAFQKNREHAQGKIRILNLHGAQNLIPALENRLIDGFVVNQPYPALAETSGVGKILAQLRDLPPEGRWHGHPCCALAASNAFIQDNHAVSTALTALLMRANQFITRDPALSQEQIAQWLNLPIEVEKRSLPTILFTSELDNQWHEGVDFWIHAMMDKGKLQNKVKEAVMHKRLQEVVYRLDIYTEARDML
ncbi:ABC transporter substrate-binding protein [Desulfogranum japonicum]|uniref:ABC transporter substrate-binding protein n=1 Tax=Desulfogranum japonicum TaxID=231447 RepID=UPI00041F89CE|nr:ABC transporter substrate-binding protein [Desulfogranum japonicum]